MTNTIATNHTTLRIALPVAENRLHGHFGGCREFAFVEADPDTKTVQAKRTVPAPPYQPGFFPLWLREQGVRVVIVGGIGERALGMFASYGMAVHAATPGASVEALVAAYLSGELLSPPAGCGHHEHHHEHDHGHHSHHDPQHAAPDESAHQPSC